MATSRSPGPSPEAGAPDPPDGAAVATAVGDSIDVSDGDGAGDGDPGALESGEGEVLACGVEDAAGAGGCVGCGVGAGVGRGVGRGVGAGVGAGAGAFVGASVGAFVGAGVVAATTITVPVIVSKWTSQKYGYVPGAANVVVNEVPARRKPSAAGRSGKRLSIAPGVPLVTVWGSPAASQVTWSPTVTVRLEPPPGAMNW